MAKKIIYKIDVDTSKAETDVKNLNDELKITQDSTEDPLVLKVNTDSATKSIKELRKDYKDLLDVMANSDPGSEEFNAASAAAGALKDSIDEVSESARALAGSPLEGIKNGLGLMGQGIRNLDLGKFLSGLSVAKTSFLAFGASILNTVVPSLNATSVAARATAAALVATGIGAVVVAIGLLVANFDKLKSAGGLIGAAFSGIAKIFTTVKNAAVDLGDALGLIDKSVIAANNAQDLVTEATLKNTESMKASLKTREELNLELEKAQGLLTKEQELIKLNEIARDKQRKALEDYRKTVGANVREIERALFDTQTQLNATRNIDEKAKLQKHLDELNNLLADEAQKKLEIESTWRGTYNLIGKVAEANETNIIKEAAKNRQEEAKADITKRQETIKKAFADELAAVNAKEQAIYDLIKTKNTQKINELNAQLTLGLITYENFLTKKQEAETAMLSVTPVETAVLPGTEDAIVRLKETLSKAKNLIILSEDEIAAIRQSAVDKSILALQKQEQERLELLITYNDARRKIVAEEIADEDAKLTTVTLLRRLAAVRNGQQVADLKLIELEAERNFANEKVQILEEALLQETEDYKAAKNAQLAAEIAFQEGVQNKAKETALTKKELAQQELVNGLNNASQLFGAAAGLASALGQLSDAQYANEIANAEGNFTRQEELRKEAFEQNKSLQLVGVIMSTASAIIGSIAAGVQMGGPWGIAVGVAAGAAAAITGAAQIATIEGTKYTPGSPASGPTPTAPTLPSAPNVQPNINFVGAGVGGSVAGQGAQMPFPVIVETQVSVSETEVTSTQSLLSSYESGAGLGGG